MCENKGECRVCAVFTDDVIELPERVTDGFDICRVLVNDKDGRQTSLFGQGFGDADVFAGMAGTQKLLKLGGRHGACEEISLNTVASHKTQAVYLIARLHALRNDTQIQPVCKADNVTHYAVLAGLGRLVADKARVKL